MVALIYPCQVTQKSTEWPGKEEEVRYKARIGILSFSFTISSHHSNGDSSPATGQLPRW